MKSEKTIGEILKDLRLDSKLSIKTVGPKVGVSYTYLSKVENNQKIPTPGLILKLCNLYKADSDNILAKAGALPDDVQDIVETYGKEAFELLRETYSGKK